MKRIYGILSILMLLLVTSINISGANIFPISEMLDSVACVEEDDDEYVVVIDEEPVSAEIKHTRVAPKDMSVYKPDFAFPGDVKAMVEAFLKAHPVSKDAAVGAERLMVLEEYAVADYNIDYSSVNSTVKNLIEIAEKEVNASTKAMIYAYAASICRTNAFTSRGDFSTPDPQKILQWNHKALVQAGDSLFNLAYSIAPANVPLADFEVALKKAEIKTDIAKNVKDFIFLKWYNTNSEKFNSEAKKIEAYSPMWFYFQTDDLKTIDERRAFLLQNIDKPNCAYGLLVYLKNLLYERNKIETADYEFIKRMSTADLPGWIKPAFDDLLTYLDSPNWTLKIDRKNAVGSPVELTLKSENTDSLDVYFYRFLSEDDMEKKAKDIYMSEDLANVKDERNIISILTSKLEKYTTLTLTPKTGRKGDTIKHTIDLPEGFYIFYSPSSNSSMIGEFQVIPWDVNYIMPTPSRRLVQVLDIQTGKGVKGLNIEAKRANSKGKTIISTTNSEGIAEFSIPIRDRVKVVDKITGYKFDSQNIYYSLWSIGEDESPESDESAPAERGDLRSELLTDSKIYQPGDTVKWMYVIVDDVKPVEGKTQQVTMTLLDGTHNEQTRETIETTPTDKFGRTSGEFVIPSDAKTGNGYLTTDYGSAHFTVAEIKLPELFINKADYTLQGDNVTLSGFVLNRVGAPRPGTPVELKITNYSDSVRTFNTVTDSDGKYSFTFARKIFAEEDDYEGLSEYRLTASQSYDIEATTIDGYNATYRGTYPIYQDVALEIESKQENDVSEGLSFIVKSERLGVSNASEPVKCKWSISKETKSNGYDIDLEEASNDIVMQGEALSGTIVIPTNSFDRVEAGNYILEVKADGNISNTVARQLTIYNSNKTELPVKKPFWLPNKTIDESSVSEVEIGALSDETILWWMPVKTKSDNKTEIKKLKLHKGFQKIKFDTRNLSKIEIWSSKDGVYTKNEIEVAPAAKKAEFTLALETFRDRTMASAKENWTLVTRLNDKPVSAAVALNVIENRVLKMRFPDMITVQPVEKREFTPWMYCQDWSNWNSGGISYSRVLKFDYDALFSDIYPEWLYFPGRYGNYGVKTYAKAAQAIPESADSSVLLRGVNTVYAKGEAAMLIEDAYEMGAMADDVTGVASGMTVMDNIELRGRIKINALWSPMLTTDERGAVDVSFVLPNQTSTWCVLGSAWTQDLKNAQVIKTFTATKPIYVTPNLPRFVRVGDKVNIVTVVTNDTDSAQHVVYDVDVCGKQSSGNFELGPRSIHYVTTAVDVDGPTALGDYLTMTFRASNGTYGDGEKVTIPILPSSALVTESTPFYMNPSDKTFTTDLPKIENESDVTELHFTANPMWTIVESLPLVLDELENMRPTSNYCAQSWYAATTALKIVKNHPVASAVIDTKKAVAMQKKAIEELKKLQESDGGFTWGSWARTSSLWTTLSVLGWFDQDIEDSGAKQMIEKALEFVDNNVVTKGTKPGINLTYAIVRPVYGKPTTMNGQAVIDNTINHAVKSWKTLPLDQKCKAAILLSRNGYNSVAKEILRSISQHGVITADRGMTFPNMPGLTSYANMLEAFYAVSPGDKNTVDAVRQGLICQRRGANWGNSGQTAYAIRAMVNAGTDWTVPAESVTVKVDGKAIELPTTMGMRGAFSVEVLGTRLEIDRKADVPAYGAVVNRRVAPLTDVKPFGTKQLTLTKEIYALDEKGQRVPVERVTLKPGQKVIVNMRIYTDTDMTNIVIEDSRSTTLEPVDQLGRYKRAENGVWYYVLSNSKATDLYIDRLPRGYTNVDYEAIVNNSGTFTTGVATLTSGVDPDLTAHSGSTILTVSDNDAH